MSDLVVTVPRNLWSEWIAEGDAVGEPESGEEWGFFLGQARPPINPGERLYIVAHDRVRGYAPVTRVAFFVDSCGWCWESVSPDCELCVLHRQDHTDRPRLRNGKLAPGRWAIGREGGAVAVTIDAHVRGFQGWRKRWWSRDDERPFPTWKTEDIWLNKARAKAKRVEPKVAEASDQLTLLGE